MDLDLALTTVVNTLRQHWLSALFLALTLLTILSFLGMRWWFRRRWKRLLEERFDEEHELDALPPFGPEDQRALERIKELRQEIWELPEAELRLGLEPLSYHATRVVRSIAAVYHPTINTPEYEASLIESLQMIRRVTARLSRLVGVTPFRFFGERRLSDYQRYYQVYRKINENPILQMLKKHRHLYRVARWAMNIKNLGNPFYWAGKELSREGYFFTLRWFYLTFISQVGREAMRLYSGRHFQKEEDRDAALICHRLFALTHQWGGPAPFEWSVLVDFVVNHSTLDADAKLQILSRWSRARFPGNPDRQGLQTQVGVQWYREGLQRLLEKDPAPSLEKVTAIRKELDAFSEAEAAIVKE